jgi:hypothetical protein
MIDKRLLIYRATLTKDNKDFNLLYNELTKYINTDKSKLTKKELYDYYLNSTKLLFENSENNELTKLSINRASLLDLYFYNKNLLNSEIERFKGLDNLKVKYNYDKIIETLNQLIEYNKNMLVNDLFNGNEDYEKMRLEYIKLIEVIDPCEFPKTNFENYIRCSCDSSLFEIYLNKQFEKNDLLNI